MQNSNPNQITEQQLATLLPIALTQGIEAANTKAGTNIERPLIMYALNKRLAIKPTTRQAYAGNLSVFCRIADVTPIDPFQFGKGTMTMAAIEDLTETWILANRDKYAPKHLNLIYNAIKAWCFTLRLINNRKLFREIKFDKSSRKIDAITESPLEPKHVKQLMQITNSGQRVVVQFYGLNGLRPALIPQLTVAQIHKPHYTIENGRLRFTVKNPFVFVPKEWEGNKAHITFFIILHSQTAALIEQNLNCTGTPVTTTSSLTCGNYPTEQGIYNLISALFGKIGFEGRPYLLRTFADRFLGKTIEKGDDGDEDLKEFMMGHKGKISAIYQFKGLSTDDVAEYTKQYQKAEQWANEHIFGTITPEQMTSAKQLGNMAQALGYSADDVARMLQSLQAGKMAFDDYQHQLTEGIRKVTEEKARADIRKMIAEEMGKNSPS